VQIRHLHRQRGSERLSADRCSGNGNSRHADGTHWVLTGYDYPPGDNDCNTGGRHGKASGQSGCKLQIGGVPFRKSSRHIALPAAPEDEVPK
jgi:hypothetical protein